MDKNIMYYLNKKIFDKHSPYVYIVAINADSTFNYAYKCVDLDSIMTGNEERKRRLKYRVVDTVPNRHNGTTFYIFRANTLKKIDKQKCKLKIN
uniref:Uncharacterized protein n=1 Tax=Helicoverpa armigera nucleopolyhedrovirus TaxID=51313 RepID=A0A0E3JBI4_9ABAC|nr:hypothetical protein ORF-17 [Helicoverpa armigera nucleopolyhedrovirus]